MRARVAYQPSAALSRDAQLRPSCKRRAPPVIAQFYLNNFHESDGALPVGQGEVERPMECSWSDCRNVILVPSISLLIKDRSVRHVHACASLRAACVAVARRLHHFLPAQPSHCWCAWLLTDRRLGAESYLHGKRSEEFERAKIFPAVAKGWPFSDYASSWIWRIFLSASWINRKVVDQDRNLSDCDS